MPVLDRDGRVRHRRGVSEVAGLYFLGLSWQHTRGSALLGWVEDDARFLSGAIGAFARGARTAVGNARPAPAAPEAVAAGRS